VRAHACVYATREVCTKECAALQEVCFYARAYVCVCMHKRGVIFLHVSQVQECFPPFPLAERAKAGARLNPRQRTPTPADHCVQEPHGCGAAARPGRGHAAGGGAGCLQEEVRHGAFCLILSAPCVVHGQGHHGVMVSWCHGVIMVSWCLSWCMGKVSCPTVAGSLCKESSGALPALHHSPSVPTPVHHAHTGQLPGAVAGQARGHASCARDAVPPPRTSNLMACTHPRSRPPRARRPTTRRSRRASTRPRKL